MKYFLLVLLGIVYSCSSLFAAVNDPDPAYREKIIRNGVKALNKLIRQNEYNDKHHVSHKNKYLLVLAGNGEFIEQRNTKDAVPLLDEGAVKAINENLVSINDQRKLGVYIIVYNNWYLDLFKSIPDNARIPYLTDLQPWSKDNIKQKIVQEMRDFSDEIFTRADFTGYEKRVSIVCGRVISLLRKAEHKTSVVINVQGDENWTTGELKALNARITGDLPDLSDVANYLIAYPNALKTAWLDKSKRADRPDLPYQYHPKSGSFLDMLGDRSLNQPTGTFQDGAIDSKSLVYDYAKVFTAEEREKLIRDFLEISQNGGYTARIFFANHNTPAEQLNRIKEIMNNPAPRDVLLYMYIDSDKTVHAQLKLGKEVPQSQEVNIFIP